MGMITGVGSAFTKNGPGVLTLTSATSPFTGPVSITQGTVAVSALGMVGTAGGLGTSGTIPLGASGTAATLRYTGSGETTDRVINMAGTGGAALEANGSGAWVLSSAIAATGIGNKTLTLAGTSTAANAIGVIPDAAESTIVSVDKTGAGRWWLTAASTYSGQLRVLDGTLVVGANVFEYGESPFGTATADAALPLIGGTASGLTGTAALLLADGVTVQRGLAVAAPGGQQVAVLGGAGTGFSTFSGGAIRLGRDVTLQAATGGTVIFAPGAWYDGDFGPNPAVAITVGSAGNAGTVALDQTLPDSITAVNVVRGTARLVGVDNRIGFATPVTVGSAGGPGTLVIDGISQALASLSFTGTGSRVTNGTLRLFNNGNAAAVTASGTGHEIASAVTLDDAATFTVNGAGKLLVSAAIAPGDFGPQPLTKLGAGTLELTAASTYEGPTTAGAGVLRFNSVAAASDPQALGAGSVVNLGVAATSAGEIDYFGATGTLDKNVYALGTGRNRVRNSGGGTLELAGTLTKDGTILELAGGAFTVSGQITGATPGSDFYVNGATVTLTNQNNDYDGPTYVYGNGTLVLGASGVIPDASPLVLGGTGADTGTGTLTTGLFTDTLASLTTGTAGATVGISVEDATAGGLTLGSLTFGAGTDTLALTLSGVPTLTRYQLLTYTGLRSGTFDSVTGLSGAANYANYTLVYGSDSNGSIDLALKADQSATFTLTPAANRVLVGGSTTLSGELVNTSPADSASLGVSLTSTGSLTAGTFTSSAGSAIAAGGTSTITAMLAAGPTAGTQSWSVVNTDSGAITTTSTASGSIDVVNQRSFTVSSGTINLGAFLRNTAVTGSTTISSSGLHATTADATVEEFGAVGPGDFGLALVDGSNVFDGGTALQQATYALTGSATSTGVVAGSFTADVTAELGLISPLTVALTGTAYDPATASFTSGSTTTSWSVDVGSFKMDSGSHQAPFDIYNLLTSVFTADLRLTAVTPLGTPSDSLAINLTPGAFGDLQAGQFSSWEATLFTTEDGSFTNVYQLDFTSAKDGIALGGVQTMLLTVSGMIVVPEPSSVILAAAGLAAAAWARRRRTAVSSPSPSGRGPG